eukprot:10243171-Ditylum_brightwellii.AAC.1
MADGEEGNDGPTSWWKINLVISSNHRSYRKIPVRDQKSTGNCLAPALQPKFLPSLGTTII